MSKKFGKTISIILLSVIALVSVLLIAGQVFLNTPKMKNIVLKIASEYVDGDLDVNHLNISLFKNFPNLNLSIEDFTLTYPHDKFGQYDGKGPQNKLRSAGRGDTTDTLASFGKFSLSLNYIKAMTGCFTIQEASLDSARIYLHCYDSLHTNLDILRLPESEEEEDTTSTLPHIVAKRIALTGNPHITFTAPQDSIFASFDMDEAIFDGKISTRLSEKSTLGLKVKNMIASAQMGRDKTEFGIDKLDLAELEENYQLDATGSAVMKMARMGRLDIPISLKMGFNFPERNLTAFSFRDFEMGIAPVKIYGEGDVRLYSDSTYVRAEMQIEDCDVDEMVQWLGKSILPDLLKIKTDASVSLTAICDGIYIPAKKILPTLLFEFIVPESKVEYEGLDKKGVIQTTINAESDDFGSLTVRVDELKTDLAGIYLEGTGSMEDVMSKDPLITLDAGCRTSLDTLVSFLPDSLGIRASGELEGKVEGLMFLSDMDFYNFAGADLFGELKCGQVNLSYAPMGLEAYLQNARISLQPTDEKLDKKYNLGGEIQALYAEIDSVYTSLGDGQIIRGKDISAIAQNAASVETEEFGKEYHPIIAQVSAKGLVAIPQENTFAGLVNSKNRFKISSRKHGEEILPILNARSDNEKIILRQGQGRVGLANTGFDVTALMVRKDTTARDSTAAFDLDKMVAGYLKDWKIYGNMKMENGFFISPYFPLVNRFENIAGSFNNNELNLDNLTIHSGKSDLTAQGKVTGIKTSILEKGILDMQLDVTSDKIDMNELLTAYNVGSQFIESNQVNTEQAMDENISDEEYMDQVKVDSLELADTARFLLMLPDRVDAKINLSANEIKYSDLQTDWAASEIAVKNSCLQITNTLATSNMGDIYFEGFYSSKSKDALKAGFDLNLASITADKVITLFPAVDSLMPMLKSFKGILDCEVAAVTDLDTLMNLKTNSINGVMKIKGKNLSLDNVGPLKKLAKVLMFKNKETGIIDDMSVEGLILNDELQVFPFVMKIDRYQFAASGIQQFDQNFKYHVSVLKSPLPFRFGINLKGNFDDWKFKLGKAKYKNTRVPVFTKELDAIQLNLVNSIHDIFDKGVDLAVQQTEQGSKVIEDEKKKTGLVLEEEVEELTLDEQIEMESTILENEVEEAVDSVEVEIPVVDPTTEKTESEEKKDQPAKKNKR